MRKRGRCEREEGRRQTLAGDESHCRWAFVSSLVAKKVAQEGKENQENPLQGKKTETPLDRFSPLTAGPLSFRYIVREVLLHTLDKKKRARNAR